VLYHYDTKFIHEAATPNCKAATIRNAWQNTYSTLLCKGHPIMHLVIDNGRPQDGQLLTSKTSITNWQLQQHIVFLPPSKLPSKSFYCFT